MRILLFAVMAPALAMAQAEPLSPDRPAKGVLPTSSAIYRTYRLDVPADVGRVQLSLDATADADLYVRQGQSMGTNWTELAQFRSTGRNGRESITIEGNELCACPYFVTVVHGGGALGERLKYTLRTQMVLGEMTAGADEVVDGRYSDDFQVPISFLPDGLNYRTFVVDVPRDAERLSLELRGAQGDLDLYARHGGPMPNWNAAHHRANTMSADETLVLDREGAPRLRTGRYYVDVANPSGWTGQATLTGRFVDGYTGPEATGQLPEPSMMEDVRGEIRQDSAWSISLADPPRYRTYVVDVPQGSKSLLVRALGAEGDIDLYLRHGAPMEDYSTEPDHSANGVQSDEQLYVDNQSSPPLRPGRYYLDIARAGPSDVGTIDLDVRFDAPEPEPLPATSGPLRDIALGERVSVDLYETGDRGARFRFNVPPDARSLDVRVLGASRDVDLFLRKGAVITSHSEDDGYDIKGVTTRLNERLELTRDSTPPLTDGVWYLDVASLVGSDERIAFDVVIAVDGEVEADELSFPPYFDNDDLTPLERAAQAIVQVSSENGSGSATMLSADGYLMTNHHVIEQDGAVQRDDIFVSFTTDFDEPPEQIFVAELVETDEELDLALLRITRDIYDRPLPSGLRLPYLELGDPEALRHGDMLYIAGFPSVGGFESRTSLSVTRGIVSGFVNDVQGNREWIKTDARINAGNSGGTALDANFGYVGVPSRERIADDDELGYSRPVTTIPAAWRALFESRR